MAMTSKNEQLCWSCANACCGCSWSRWFEPVEGWTANKTVIVQFGYRTESYEIIDCPEYENDTGYKTTEPTIDFKDLDIYLVKGSGDINKGENRRTVERIPEQRLRSYLPKLEPNEQNVIMICVIKNLSAVDAAYILHYSESRIRHFLNNAIRKILYFEKVNQKTSGSAIGEN